VRQRKYEQQRDRENATHEREKPLLRLENVLLRFERLPPGSAVAERADRGPLESLHSRRSLRKQ